MLSGTVLGSLGFLAALGLARNSVGGSIAAISIISLLPVFQTALYVRDRLGLWIVLGGVAAFYLAPLVFIGPPDYPASGYRGALLAVAVSSIVGLVTHRLVADIRHRASDARRRERILVRVNETVQQLFQSTDPRHDACRAVHEVSEALSVGLYEPDPLTGALLLTATTGTPDAIAAGAPARWGSAVHDAFSSKRQRLICDDVEAYVGNVELWRAEGAPHSLLYQPLLTGDGVVGVLFVGWADTRRSQTSRALSLPHCSHVRSRP